MKNFLEQKDANRHGLAHLAGAGKNCKKLTQEERRALIKEFEQTNSSKLIREFNFEQRS